MLVVLAEAVNPAGLVVAVLGPWTLMDQTFVVVVALKGHWTLMNLLAGNVNLDAAVSAAPLRCGLT